jgi:hypothetical protein
MADIAVKLAELAQLRESSMALLAALTREGMGNLDLGGARLEILVEALLPWDEGKNEARVDFELAWEKAANGALEELKSQLVKAKLTQGVSLVPPSPPNGHGPLLGPQRN